MPENENQVQEPVMLAGYALEPSITVIDTANGVISRPSDNDGNYENYVDAAPYDGYAKRISHDTDNIAFRIYDHDYNPESPEYGVFINDEYVTETTMVVGDAKKFEIRAVKLTETAPEQEGEDSTITAENKWTDDIPGMAWVSEDPETATIIEGNKVWARKPGTVNVHAYNSNETAFKATLRITIVEASEENVFTIVV